MAWITRVMTTDGDFDAMMKSGKLPQGGMVHYSKAADMGGALAIVAQYYEQQRQGLVRITNKPKIAAVRAS